MSHKRTPLQHVAPCRYALTSQILVKIEGVCERHRNSIQQIVRVSFELVRELSHLAQLPELVQAAVISLTIPIPVSRTVISTTP